MRRVWRRPKARLRGAVSVVAVVLTVVACLVEKLAASETKESDWTLALICGGVAVLAGTLAFVCRFTERPRQTLVRDEWPWPEPPVIHAKRER